MAIHKWWQPVVDAPRADLPSRIGRTDTIPNHASSLCFWLIDQSVPAPKAVIGPDFQIFFQIISNTTTTQKNG